MDNAGEFARQTDPGNSDTDVDGLTDGSEVHTHGTNPVLADTDGDGDGDGLEVLETGLDPNDPTELFRGEILEVTATPETLRCQSAPDKVYSVWRMTDLVNDVRVATDLPSNGGGYQSYTDTPTVMTGRAYFRIEVSPAP